MVGSLGDYGPMEDVVDIGPDISPATNFPGSGESDSGTYYADITNVYYQLVTPGIWITPRDVMVAVGSSNAVRFTVTGTNIANGVNWTINPAGLSGGAEMQTNGYWYYRDVIPGNVATSYLIRAASKDNTNLYDEVNLTVLKVESINGLQNLYCTHQDCSANLTAVLSSGANLPAGCSIVWEGDADFSNQSGLTVTAKFANHAGKNKKVTAKIGSQSPAAESSTFTVVDDTDVTNVTVVTYNFVWADPGALYGIFAPQPLVADITAYFNHPSHTWKCKVTSATDESQRGWHLVSGVSEASVAAATTEAIYCKMVADLLAYGEGGGIQWYMLSAVQAHETMHSDDWKNIVNPRFTTFRTTVEALSVPYADGTCETPAQAKTAILALSAYQTAVDTLKNSSIAAWNDQLSASEVSALAAEALVTSFMIAALDEKAAAQEPPWTR